MIPTETSRSLCWGDRINSLGGCDEVLYHRRVDAFTIRNAEDDGGRSRYKWPNFQTWAGQPNEILCVQPSLQYIINPGGDKSTPNALAVGVNVVFNF
jgi:carbohydrate-selective porin OprB